MPVPIELIAVSIKVTIWCSKLTEPHLSKMGVNFIFNKLCTGALPFRKIIFQGVLIGSQLKTLNQLHKLKITTKTLPHINPLKIKVKT